MRKKRPPKKSDRFYLKRKAMVDDVLVPMGIRDRNVLDAMSKVPRHLFLEEALWNHAYENRSLPIGHRQTISQPYTVALMTETLKLKPTDKVLEIGMGSGYQAAVLAEIVEKVVTIERIKSIWVATRKLLERMGYLNIMTACTDGTSGYPDQAPYDSILVSAAGPDVPEALLRQLKPIGRLIMPIANDKDQRVLRLIKNGDRVTRKMITPCTFVKLVGRHGFEEGS